MSEKENIKAFNVRVSKELWTFLKRTAIEQETSLNEIVGRCLNKFKENREKVLTSRDTLVE